MREILFRGKCLSCYSFKFGDLLHVDDECKISALSFVNDPDTDCCCDAFVGVDPETVGQYTGLCDKNGTKIFEGDILSGYLDDLFPEEESRYEVIWHDYGWHIRSNGFLDTPDNGWLKENFEVIGNIHDNPELLEVAEND